MALLFLDSFDHYVTVDLTEKWTSLVGSAQAIAAATGRRSSASLQFTNTNSAIRITLAPGAASIVFGFGVKLTAIPSATRALAAVLSSGTHQISLCVHADGTLGVDRGAAATLLGSASTVALAAGTFYYVECAVTFSDTVGTIAVHVNGASVLSATGLDTLSTGTTWNSFQLGDGVTTGGPVAVTWDFDDLYVLDGSGSAPLNTFLGDCRVDARYPTAEGASSAWTPLSGSDNALMVDETAPDDDTTYNSTGTIGATDTHVVQDAPVAGATIYGVQLCLSTKKSDAGTCAIAPVVRHSGTNYVGTAANPGTSYAYQVMPYGTNPGTGVAWTESGFNAAEFGYQRTA